MIHPTSYVEISVDGLTDRWTGISFAPPVFPATRLPRVTDTSEATRQSYAHKEPSRPPLLSSVSSIRLRHSIYTSASSIALPLPVSV